MFTRTMDMWGDVKLSKTDDDFFNKINTAQSTENGLNSVW